MGHITKVITCILKILAFVIVVAFFAALLMIWGGCQDKITKKIVSHGRIEVESRPLKVVTFNLYKARFGKRFKYLKVFESLDADIIVVNEAKNIATISWLAEQLRLHHITTAEVSNNVAILSRYKFIVKHHYHFPKISKKSLLMATIEVGGKRIDIWATHLRVTGKKKRYIESIMIMRSVINRRKETKNAFILMGDLNEVSHFDKKYRRRVVSNVFADHGMLDVYRFCNPDKKGNTYANRRIDFIFVSKDLLPVSSKTIYKETVKKWPSDHRAVCAELSFK